MTERERAPERMRITSAAAELFMALERMRITSAWYWRHRGDDRPQAWEFLQYGKPDHWWGQMEYVEIKT